MSEMVERVARAQAGRRWDSFDDEHKAAARELARAAIDAMRVPTEAMIAAFRSTTHLSSTLSDTEHNEMPLIAWQAMIDEALK